MNYVFKAEFFLLDKNNREAIENFKIWADLANKNNYKHLEQYCYENLANAYLKFNDCKSAFAYKEKFQQLKDTSDNLITKAKVAELQIQFETEKKEKLLAELVCSPKKQKEKSELLFCSLL